VATAAQVVAVSRHQVLLAVLLLPIKATLAAAVLAILTAVVAAAVLAVLAQTHLATLVAMVVLAKKSIHLSVAHQHSKVVAVAVVQVLALTLSALAALAAAVQAQEMLRQLLVQPTAVAAAVAVHDPLVVRLLRQAAQESSM
jgi:hypothetical protein